MHHTTVSINFLKVFINFYYYYQSFFNFVQQICEDPKALERVIKSYEMMLDFYGLKLVDESSGKLCAHAAYF